MTSRYPQLHIHTGSPVDQRPFGKHSTNRPEPLLGEALSAQLVSTDRFRAGVGGKRTNPTLFPGQRTHTKDENVKQNLEKLNLHRL